VDIEKEEVRPQGRHKAEKAVQLRMRLGSRLCRGMVGRVSGAPPGWKHYKLPEKLTNLLCIA
jgi:hypothetical protein